MPWGSLPNAENNALCRMPEQKGTSDNRAPSLASVAIRVATQEPRVITDIELKSCIFVLTPSAWLSGWDRFQTAWLMKTLPGFSNGWGRACH